MVVKPAANRDAPDPSDADPRDTGPSDASGATEAAASPELPHFDPIPRHVAIIMDGNGRWAEQRGLRRQAGHRAGAEAVRAVIERLGQHGVEVVTLFAFSTENWNRPRVEVEAIMRLAGRVIDRDLAALQEAGARLIHVGELDPLPGPLRTKVRRAIERTADNTRITVALAFNYGGRADIVSAARRLVADGVPPDEIDEEAIAQRLSTATIAEPDLLIRTGGEHRISNFLVWQAAYAELYFTGTLWPDFGVADIDDALREFSRRSRKFGGVPQADRPDTTPTDR